MAIHEMASETNGLVWRSNAVRVIVLTTDAPFHTGRCGCACCLAVLIDPSLRVCQ